MADTVFYKPSHSAGPATKIYDLGSGTFVEGDALLGWDPIGLQWVKIKVDSSGQVFIANPGGGGTTTVSGDVHLTAGTETVGAVFQATSPWVIGGTTTTVPSGTQAVSQTGSPWGISGTVTATQSGVWSVTVTQGTGTNLHAVIDSGTVTAVQSGTYTTAPSGIQTVAGAVTVTGTVTNVPSGTQTIAPTGTQAVSGTVTVQGTTTVVPSGTQTVKSDGGNFIVTQGTATNLNATVAGTVTTVPSGTQAVSQSGSPWGISGTVTTTPSGTQTVLGTVNVILDGTTTQPVLVAGTANVAIPSIGTSLDNSGLNALAVNDYAVRHELELINLNAQIYASVMNDPGHNGLPRGFDIFGFR